MKIGEQGEEPLYGDILPILAVQQMLFLAPVIARRSNFKRANGDSGAQLGPLFLRPFDPLQ